MSTTTETEAKPAESARRQKTRERLMDAAFEVFSEVGIHAASVEMIAERADFTRGAFYSNFDTKEELFLALAERGNNERLALLRGSVANIDVIMPSLVGPTEGKLSAAELGPIVASFLEQQGLWPQRRLVLYAFSNGEQGWAEPFTALAPASQCRCASRCDITCARPIRPAGGAFVVEQLMLLAEEDPK